MKSEDWERRRLAGETPALPGGRGGSTHSSQEFSCSVARQRLMGTYVGGYFFNGLLSGQGRKFGDVCGEEFSAPARRERRAYPASGSVRSEQRRRGRKEPPPEGLRRIWPEASLLVGHSPTGGDAPSSRLAPGQIGRNKRHRIYAHDHQGEFH